MFWAALGWLGLVGVAALTASWLPLDPNAQDLRHSNEPPSLRHVFGTTRLGEDLFARVVHGSRVSVVVGIGATALALSVGGLVGLVAGYFRGGVDTAITVVLDALSAFPALVLAVALVLFIGPGLATVTIVVGLLTVPIMARVTRVATREVSGRLYIEAARSLGAGPARMLRVEVTPNIAVPVLSYALVAAGIAMLAEGALSFLGVGVGVTKTSWGQLVAAGQGALVSSPHLALFPAGALFLTVLSLNYVGEQLTVTWARLGMPASRRRPARRSRAQVAGPVSVASPATPAPATPAPASPAPASPAPASPAPAPAPAAAAPATAPRDRTDRLVVEDFDVAIDTPQGALLIVRQVSFRLAPGSTLAIVGESGSGKTMLARGLIGVAPAGTSLAVGGRALLDGTDLAGLSPEAMRRVRGRRVAMVFQDPMTALDPVMRVGAQIAELARVHLGLSRRAADARAVELLAEVGIAEPAARARAFPHELSGGLRQRVSIAMALAGEPSLLIADEPTSALDVTTQAQILDLLDRLRRQRAMSLVLISHDLSLVAARADVVAVLYAGQIVELGPPGPLFGAPRMPYTAGLIASRPPVGGPPHRRLAVLAGQAPPAGQEPPGCAFAPRCSRALPVCSAGPPPVETEGLRQYRCCNPLAGEPQGAGP